MIVLAGILEGISTRKGDKSLKLTIGTQEVSPEKAGELMTFQDSHLYLAMKEETFNPSEIESFEKLKADFESGKTPSQRLRGVLYRVWEAEPEGYQDFNRFYDFKMETLIEHFKTKLD